MVGTTGFEPVTSALSRRRSKPTELSTPMNWKTQNYKFLSISSQNLKLVFHLLLLFLKSTNRVKGNWY